MPRIALIPIYIDMKHYAGEQTLQALLSTAMRAVWRPAFECQPEEGNGAVAQVVYAALAQPDTRFLILLDSLDELTPQHQTVFRRLLSSILASRHHIVISADESTLDEMLHGDIATFVLRPFSIVEIDLFVQRTLPQESARNVLNHLQRNKDLAALSAHPLMLSLLVTLTQAHPHVRLATSSARLLHQYVAQAMHNAPDGKLHAVISPRVVLSVLGQVAFEMQERQCPGIDFDSLRTWPGLTNLKRLEEALAQAEIWGLLKPGARKRVEFPHRILLQYFAALHLHTALQHGQSYSEVLGARLLSQRWSNVIAMLASSMDRNGGLIRWLADVLRNPVRTITAIAPLEIPASAHITHPRAQSDLLRDWGERLRDCVARVLGHIGAPAVNDLVALLNEDDPNARWRVVEVLGRIGVSNVTPSLVRSTHDSNLWVRRAAVHALGHMDDRGAVAPLTAMLDDPSDNYLRNDITTALNHLSHSTQKSYAELGSQYYEGEAVDPLEKLGGTRHPPYLPRSSAGA
jgi:hypothetical protein